MVHVIRAQLNSLLPRMDLDPTTTQRLEDTFFVNTRRRPGKRSLTEQPCSGSPSCLDAVIGLLREQAGVKCLNFPPQVQGHALGGLIDTWAPSSAQEPLSEMA